VEELDDDAPPCREREREKAVGEGETLLNAGSFFPPTKKKTR